MKKIMVRKVFSYDPTFNGKYTRYQGYKLSGLQASQPKAILPKAFGLKIGLSAPIFCSPLKRSQQSAKFICKKSKINRIVPVLELAEILFDLSELLSEDEYDKFGSNLVRERFVQAFLDNKLIEPRQEIKKRIDSLLEKLAVLSDGNYLLVSHSFFMKLLEIYLKDNRLFDQPDLLRRYFDFKKKTFDYGDGFNFTL